MDDMLPTPLRRRHTRANPSIADLRSIQRSVSCAAPPALALDTPGASGSNVRITTRIVSTMRRSLSVAPRRRDTSPPGGAMYSTPAESTPPLPPRFDTADAPLPTVQQIAMGLHVSRTPHLRSPRASPLQLTDDSAPLATLQLRTRAPTPRRRASTSTPALPPPPARSSLKKPRPPTPAHSPTPPRSAPLTPTASDLSLTGSTLTCGAPPPVRGRGTSVAVPFIPGRLQLSMPRFLRVPSGRKAQAQVDSGAVDAGAARKVVRFSTVSSAGSLPDLHAPPGGADKLRESLDVVPLSPPRHSS
ncbi:hypothetical protein WOLCODRAFT_20526 [Wolfiporia cocos MD-104 SS10]|uniref:Uncharacterized protein n=1 Tax=Wolfiporia cocos (strain MD-104) TaxID=742152 RepID=A0A2H3J2E7_WOLCO|nr:hypothetical protein WOLCODRAFT_20526 [Wolfiporia cocos MD-104 SS10]